MGQSYSKGGFQTEKMQSKQKVILDQHYSNNIFMTVMSTLESLEALFKNSQIKRQEKMYGYYDKVRFDDKNIQELKSQLQTQLVLLKASRQVFQQQNPSEKYQHPDSFNKQKIKGELAYFSNVFKSDPQILGMCRDFERINEGDFNGKMKFQDNKFDLKYSEKQKISHQKGIFGRGVQASFEMDAQKRQV